MSQRLARPETASTSVSFPFKYGGDGMYASDKGALRALAGAKPMDVHALPYMLTLGMKQLLSMKGIDAITVVRINGIVRQDRLT